MNSSHYPLAGAGRRATLLGTGLALLLSAALTSGWAQSPSEGRPSRGPAPAAGRQDQAAELRKAAWYSERACIAPNAAQRLECYDRAVTIYARLGRPQKVIEVGLRYRDFLDSGGGRAAGQGDARWRLRELNLHLGQSYLALGHYPAAERHLGQAVADLPGVDPLPPVLRIGALADLARCAEKRGERDRAGRLWKQVETFVRDQLEHPNRELTPKEQIQFVWSLADGYQSQQQWDRAIAWLGRLLPLHDRLRDRAGKRDTLRRLAGNHGGRKDYTQAEKCLRQALALHDGLGSADRLTRAELADELAEMLFRQKYTDEAQRRKNADEVERWRGQAEADYKANLTGPDAARVVAAFWKLQALYQKRNDYDEALRLAEDQEKEWGNLLGGPRLKSERGGLQIILGSFTPALRLLREAVTDIEKQSLPSNVDLARAYSTLAIAEKAAGDLVQAEDSANKCLQLYERLAWPDDLLVVECYNVLGTCLAQRGQYSRAIQKFREGTDRCNKLGRVAAALSSRLQLNRALLYKSQGDLDEALRACQEARDVYERFVDRNPRFDAAFNTAQANLYAAQGRKGLARAHGLAQRVLDYCKEAGIEGDTLMVTARHCQGLYHLARRDYAAAERAWSELRALQKKEKSSPLLPRTLFYLGLTAERQGKAGAAEELYQEALRLHRESKQRSFPVSHFIALWRLAGLADKREDPKQARALLTEAVGVVEETRLQTYGDAQQRATFFAQFEPGFDQLVDWCVRDRDIEAAFRAATRSRSRTLLDQLQLAGADPREALRGDKGGEALLSKEEDLRRQISSLRARAQLIPEEDMDKPRAEDLRKELDQAQREYIKVRQEILNTNQVYRSLSADDRALAALSTFRDQALGPKTLLLVYHIGRERSHLMLLGGGATRAEAFSLAIPPEEAAELMAPPATGRWATLVALVNQALGGYSGDSLRRGFRKVPVPGQREGAMSVPAPGPDGKVLLNRSLARALVERYSHEIEGGRADRGLRIVPLVPGHTAPLGRALAGHVLLPPEVRRRIRQLAPECLVVVPDGPLHRLPLEALVLETTPRLRYALDELPPIVYAPSAAVLTLLAKRKPLAPGPLSLLTVCNPAYRNQKEEQVAVNRVRDRGGLAWGGQLSLLPGTSQESRGIRQFFDEPLVRVLEGPSATKRAVRQGVGGKRMIHLAVHGFADEGFGNLFGALALTKEDAEDDGFLSLHEIYQLPLKDCELAVLSACSTNVGPQQPLEAGVTLASGFLAAGAHRVVASHWGVDDESTAVLMTAFFKEVTAAAKGKDPVRYARALHKARLEVRNTPEWSEPFYWAPFVLIGPAE